MSATGNMKTVAEIQQIIDSNYTFIPLLQRNYKWSRECASELAEDLWTAFRNGQKCYQLNMVTIYKDENSNSLQILDGQQRLITLKLLLVALDSANIYLNYDFERDYSIDERCGRRYFVNHLLPNLKDFESMDFSSVDVLRLFDNFVAMRIPLSFKTIYEAYCKILDANKDSVDKNEFRDKINGNVEKCLNMLFEDEKAKDLVEHLNFSNEEVDKVYNYCEEFQKSFINPESDEDISNDEIRVSAVSDKFQNLWIGKVREIHEKLQYKDATRMVGYILNSVEMLYHETSSEPIDEFLNINENKTRFVISDYIRANMISDNPIDGESLTPDVIDQNKENRDNTLKLFAEIAEYLYSEKYETMWRLIKKRYDDFEKHPDINRMKVVFCDKYIGTSTKNYDFDEEFKRLQYFKDILDALKTEIGIGKGDADVSWNTYNAVYMLLECKEKYRFFSLFTNEDIDKKTDLSDVAARERFCFFEYAYDKSKDSDDIWDLSYFLESQLFEDECKTQKCKCLPNKRETKANSEWVYIDRGTDNDALNNCIKKMISEIKEMG